jgi:hypothetical protein
MAGFEVTLYGRIWVTPEVLEEIEMSDTTYNVIAPEIGVPYSRSETTAGF